LKPLIIVCVSATYGVVITELLKPLIIVCVSATYGVVITGTECQPAFDAGTFFFTYYVSRQNVDLGLNLACTILLLLVCSTPNLAYSAIQNRLLFDSNLLLTGRQHSSAMQALY